MFACHFTVIQLISSAFLANMEGEHMPWGHRGLANVVHCEDHLLSASSHRPPHSTTSSFSVTFQRISRPLHARVLHSWPAGSYALRRGADALVRVAACLGGSVAATIRAASSMGPPWHRYGLGCEASARGEWLTLGTRNVTEEKVASLEILAAYKCSPSQFSGWENMKKTVDEILESSQCVLGNGCASNVMVATLMNRITDYFKTRYTWQFSYWCKAISQQMCVHLVYYLLESCRTRSPGCLIILPIGH